MVSQLIMLFLALLVSTCGAEELTSQSCSNVAAKADSATRASAMIQKAQIISAAQLGEQALKDTVVGELGEHLGHLAELKDTLVHMSEIDIEANTSALEDVDIGGAVLVRIGKSRANKKCVRSKESVVCDKDAGNKGKRTNSDHRNAGDSFDITVSSGKEVCARRLRSNGGWGMNLQIKCTSASSSQQSTSDALDAADKDVISEVIEDLKKSKKALEDVLDSGSSGSNAGNSGGSGSNAGSAGSGSGSGGSSSGSGGSGSNAGNSGGASQTTKPATPRPTPQSTPRPVPSPTPSPAASTSTGSAKQYFQIHSKTGKSGGGWQPEKCLEQQPNSEKLKWLSCQDNKPAQLWAKSADGYFISASDGRCIKRGDKISSCGRYYVLLSNTCDDGKAAKLKSVGKNEKIDMGYGHCMIQAGDQWTKKYLTTSDPATYVCNYAHTIAWTVDSDVKSVPTPSPTPEPTPAPPGAGFAAGSDYTLLRGKTGKSGGGWRDARCIEAKGDTVMWLPCADKPAQRWSKPGGKDYYINGLDGRCMKRGSLISGCGRDHIILSTKCDDGKAGRLKPYKSHKDINFGHNKCILRTGDPWTKKLGNDGAAAYNCPYDHTTVDEYKP